MIICSYSLFGDYVSVVKVHVISVDSNTLKKKQMKLAIMQPYFFPYIGYFQLMSAVDKFVVYDDVNFIKQGWINRNNILINGKKHLFSIPVKNISSYRLIKDTELAVDVKWRKNFCKTISQAYNKAPFFEPVNNIIEKVINTKSKFIRDWNLSSIEIINNYIGINTILVESSSIYANQNLIGQERVIDICLKENSQNYFNSIGGQNIYDKQQFLNVGIGLNFLRPGEVTYRQFNNKFVPRLSMIDVMMFNSIERLNDMLTVYELI